MPSGITDWVKDALGHISRDEVQGLSGVESDIRDLYDEPIGESRSSTITVHGDEMVVHSRVRDDDGFTGADRFIVTGMGLVEGEDDVVTTTHEIGDEVRSPTLMAMATHFHREMSGSGCDCGSKMH